MPLTLGKDIKWNLLQLMINALDVKKTVYQPLVKLIMSHVTRTDFLDFIFAINIQGFFSMPQIIGKDPKSKAKKLLNLLFLRSFLLYKHSSKHLYIQ